MKQDNNNKYVKTFESDLYIMIPFTTNKKMLITSKETDEYSNEFLKYINKYSISQCNSQITKDLKRYFIGKNYLICLSYDYEKEIDKEEIYLYLTIHKETGLCLLTIMNLNNHFSPTQLEDQVTTDNIFIYDNLNNKININEYMEKNFGLIRCGESKTLLSLSKKPDNFLEFKCMLASETFKPFIDNTLYYILKSNEIDTLAKNNFSQYQYYELYASKSSVIYILNTFSDNTLLNIQDEITILFIMELIMFQSASVLRTNNKIVNQLAQNGSVSLKFIENLYKEFGKTIRFWNKNVFKYETVQNISFKINTAFETQNILDEYYKNQKFLEHIVSLRDIQDSNKESKILNGIVLILTIIQVVPVIIEFINWIFKTDIKFISVINNNYLLNSSILILIIVAILFTIKRKNKKKNMLN